MENRTNTGLVRKWIEFFVKNKILSFLWKIIFLKNKFCNFFKQLVLVTLIISDGGSLFGHKIAY